MKNQTNSMSNRAAREEKVKELLEQGDTDLIPKSVGYIIWQRQRKITDVITFIRTVMNLL